MIELGIHRISRLLSLTALPWRGIHVAGTNGKGSICAYISSMLETYNRSSYRQALRHAPLKHARFTSPHLIDRWDCITLDQKPVLAEVFKEIEEKMLERNRMEAIGASEFEILTATVFEIFSKEGVDVGVVEVGMGGRLDATNIIGQGDGIDVPDGLPPEMFRPPPLMTAISSIGLDHQAFLGNTLEAIAREKAGIIKPRVPVVLAPNEPVVMNVVEEVAHAHRSPIYHSLSFMTPEETTNSPRSIPSLISYLIAHHTPHYLPRHSHQNALTAFTTTLLALQRLGRLPVDTAKLLAPTSSDLPLPPVIDMFQAPFHTTFPGRLQQISLEYMTGRTEAVLLDGAHNAQSATALATEIERLRYREKTRDGNVTFVLAASDSKPAEEILRPLLRDGDEIFTVEFGPVDGMPWVKPQSNTVLAEAARSVVSDGASLRVHEYGGDVFSALRAASEAAVGGRPMVVAGSLYLVGDVLRLLRDAPGR